MKIILKAPAKINLFLEIKNKREDGYHELESIMQTVSLYDELSFELTDKNIFLECNSKTLPTDSTNIVYKAVKAFHDYFKIDKGVKIYLKKTIPMGAGLGGGSSDAAATLAALAKLYNVKTNKNELEQIATKLGADVSFFLTGGTALCEGIGDIITPLKTIKNLNVILVNPGFGVNTAGVYKKVKFPLTKKAEITKIKAQIDNSSFNTSDAFSCCFNRLEDFVLTDYPEIAKIRDVLRATGCISLMSGSGATVFGLFDSNVNLESIRTTLNKYSWKFWFVNSTELSFQHQLSTDSI
ncbi:MAG: 4-(cytidine 5'-diphospho)-2-C-methyl-D-erythritol kinase [Endomicrobium sp.]|jgi:4-diphosphocytidyl-2-C-methyl-D-erythritol kinase|nr:4-(cytidine 5'-diphospho)-2-C-methyl-D-erythritol kinase [Endomicrobium sp.]